MFPTSVLPTAGDALFAAGAVFMQRPHVISLVFPPLSLSLLSSHLIAPALHRVLNHNFTRER